MKFETIALHAGHTVDQDSLSRAVPIYRTSAYLFKSTEHAANLFALKELGNIYTRIGNPTQAVLEERVAQLEGGAAALALASGTSAIFYSIINICSQGDEVVAANNLYGGTYSQFDSILPQMGIKVHLVDPSEPENFTAAINDRTRLLYCETLGNPALNMTDIRAVADIAHRPPAAAGRRLDLYPALHPAADRARRRYRHPLADQVDGRARHRTRRDRRRRRQLRLDRPEIQALQRAGRHLPRPALCP